jgi:hypothetical protein
MSILFAIREDDAGMWCICRAQTCLTNRLTLAQAITDARKLARDHHERTGLTASVDMVSPEGTTRLGRYGRSSTEADDATVA